MRETEKFTDAKKSYYEKFGGRVDDDLAMLRAEMAQFSFMNLQTVICENFGDEFLEKTFDQLDQIASPTEDPPEKIDKYFRELLELGIVAYVNEKIEKQFEKNREKENREIPEK